MIAKTRLLYTRLKPQIPTICFLGGSLWDTLTLRRIDNALDMAIFSGYLLLSAIIVVLIARRSTFKFSQYLPHAAQFFFGGLFSACTVYYFKSTSSLLSFLFLLSLAGMLVGNEFLEKKYSNAQIVFTFWSICAAMILNFLVPVLFNRMNSLVFLASILTALIICLLIRQISLSGSLSIKTCHCSLLNPDNTLYSSILYLLFQFLKKTCRSAILFITAIMSIPVLSKNPGGINHSKKVSVTPLVILYSVSVPFSHLPA